ncbi:hypothetical protein N431DRAFT_446708 [Stipitochalara longipes BDJ]|nr:hypothetical protein N431DRAFT_446708 [Stipitochalara longipes BDJ]
MNTPVVSQYQAGRAKRACLSCLRKRRWCDRSLPKCLICTEAQRQCEGYAPDVIRTFVNLNATNASRPNKKRLLCESLADSKKSTLQQLDTPHNDSVVNQTLASSSESEPQLGGIPVVSLQATFPQHVEALWRTFLLEYCQTADYWPPGCSFLALQNRALDLSLVGLSAHRLALNFPGSELLVLGLTAYNNSIRLFRRLMQQEHNNGLVAMLAVISTVYALTEASLMQPEDIANFGWGKSGHFDGALALMQKCGPVFFSLDGFHLVFKKIREMGAFLALTRRHETFLLEEEWMTTPWKSQPKTWRDKLYDLVVVFSEVVASSQGNDHASNQLESIRTEIDKALKVEAELSAWKSSWLNEAYPSHRIRCHCQAPAQFSCLCSLSALNFPTTDFALLQVECWSLQLLISITLRKLSDSGADPPVWIAHLPVRSSQIANFMDEALPFPIFKYTTDRSSGITEGLCRTILATWTLREYRGIQGGNEERNLDSKSLETSSY